ncbi:unnamed protein product, partial [Closterium sp. NIES-54]
MVTYFAVAYLAEIGNSKAIGLFTVRHVFRKRRLLEVNAVLHASGNDDVLTFEVGAGNFVGNPLFKGFDEAVKGLAVGQSRTVQSAPMAKTDEMIFRVPKDHEEIERLTKEQGGVLKAGAVVVLANGGPAEILD